MVKQWLPPNKETNEKETGKESDWGDQLLIWYFDKKSGLPTMRAILLTISPLAPLSHAFPSWEVQEPIDAAAQLAEAGHSVWGTVFVTLPL